MPDTVKTVVNRLIVPVYAKYDTQVTFPSRSVVLSVVDCDFRFFQKISGNLRGIAQPMIAIPCLDIS